jgi:hypothetical protein
MGGCLILHGSRSDPGHLPATGHGGTHCRQPFALSQTHRPFLHRAPTVEKHFDARTLFSAFMMVCWYCGRSSHLPFHLASGVPGVLLVRHFVTAGVISVSTHRSQFGRAPEGIYMHTSYGLLSPRSGPDACWPRHLCPGAARHWFPDPLGAPHHLDHSGRCQGPAHIFCSVLLDSPQGYSVRVRPPVSAVSQSRCSSKLANLLTLASEHQPDLLRSQQNSALLYQALPVPPAEQISCGKACSRTQGSCSA